MALLEWASSLTPQQWAFTAVGAIALLHIVPYLWDANRMRKYPGPFLAKFSYLWLGYHSMMGHRSEVVHEMHRQYGSWVRLAPNYLSIADPDALQIVYAHGNGTSKSDFYDAFVSIRRGVFNSRDRAEHTRKRKIISHIFSAKSVAEFEPSIRLHVMSLIEQWDKYTDMAKKGMSGKEGTGWFGKDNWLWFDCLPWFNFLAFDIIGDLAFGAPFGMIETGADAAPVPKGGVIDCKDETEIEHVPAVQIINDRGEFSMSLGVLPPSWRPIVRRLPWFSNGGMAVRRLAGIAIVAVNKRLKTPTDRVDLLQKLMQGKDDQGLPMGREELTAEAQTQLIAGSDTTSNTSCAIVYWLARYPEAQKKLQKELDDELGVEDEIASTAEQVKRLTYLDAVINEAMRLHSTSALGLPRLVPEDGIHVLGEFFPEGAVLGVPSYTIHRDPQIWGEDVEVYRPERWFEQDAVGIQKTFNPFSFGPRACVGKNLATLELQIIISSLLRRYEFVLQDPTKDLPTAEGFLRKPLDCHVMMRRRDA
ncbi:cytochrome P450 monooxygenase pc-bph [Pterulicium gracile]|uniref:Cytochrome P450 monooxygenase pc-bph n=1 Tax=Pterulicium gracile TaxID=1884261 RepID=A0A5C3QT13_9AGAR|nr:cytochrome P450 monooxygenase pc-bph [Pterula gracilis]